MSKKRMDAASGFVTIRVRGLVEHPGSRPPDDHTPGFAIWGTEVYEDGIHLGRVASAQPVRDVLTAELTGEHEIYYEPAVAAGGSA